MLPLANKHKKNELKTKELNLVIYTYQRVVYCRCLMYERITVCGNVTRQDL